MTKIYNANTFLEADQIIATLQSQHISAEKREISDMNVSRAARIYAIAALGIIAVMICLSLVL